jgi:ketosteroid isomerase-like protein
MRRVRLAFLAVVVPVFLCGSARAQPPNDVASVTAFYQKWMGSAAQGFTAYASYYAQDGYILPPGHAPVVGREAIVAWFEKTSAAATYTTRPQAVTVDETRFLSSDWVIRRSTLKGQRVPKAGGDPVAFETKYFDLLHRNAAGNWEVASRMWSDNH